GGMRSNSPDEEIKSELFWNRVARTHYDPVEIEGIGGSNIRTSHGGDAARETSLADQFACVLGDVGSSAEGIREQPHWLAELLVEFALGSLQLEPRGLLVCGAQVDVSVGGAPDFEALGDELAQLVPIHPTGTVREAPIPWRDCVRADKPRGDEEGRRQAVLAKNGRGDLEVVAIAVVERDR